MDEDADVIAWLEGSLREKTPTHVLLDVNGVGYELLVSLQSFERLPDCGKTLAMHVRTVVREDAFLLFGFATSLERDAFDLLVRANRVGPKLAQAILSGIEPERLLHALREGDQNTLRRVPGVGPKLAERIGVELREGASDLLGQIGASAKAADPVGAPGSGKGVREQLLSALLNLGYPRSQAERVVDAAGAEAGEGASIESLIRVALRRLAR
ncbi:MAG: Holliday junction branch migration protein RuvA [Deltaproteobacteria bacterium]|nr:Holliday junction branch migration protein RuvA [Deltaproteobacteria bacterium]MBW2696280.1 Holliday junction branch migration protein RuvA [Deltaproteobacteria bacterium]